MLLSSFAGPTIKGKKTICIRTGFQHANILPLSAGFEKGIEPIVAIATTRGIPTTVLLLPLSS